MILLLEGMVPALAVALALGGFAGWLAGLPRNRTSRAIAAMLASLLAGLAVLGVVGSVPGIDGLWIETAGLMLGVYLVGCVLGGLARTLASRPA